ncbi:unnamed protein product [Agarophyton chilense]
MTVGSPLSSLPYRTVRIIHFNDVYNVQQGVSEPVGGAARFVSAINTQIQRFDGECLVLFSGDAFSPAPLTSLTAGSEIPPVLNACRVDVACIGNHELDNGLQVMQQRLSETNFPWVMSNVWQKPTHSPDSNHLQQPLVPLANLPSSHTITRAGIKFGFIGLASWDWLSAVHQDLLRTLQYVNYAHAARQMATMLKHQMGCDFVIALTHMRNPDDFLLAESSSVDLVLGGHDHVLLKQLVGSTWILKSGSDFKNYSILDLHVSPDREVRVSEPCHYDVTSDIPEDPRIARLVAEKLALLGPRWTICVAESICCLDGRFASIRTRETTLGNFVADAMTDIMGADVGLLNSGSFRSDSIHPVGSVTLGMIDTILPYKDQVVVAEYSGAELLQRLECSVSQYPNLVGSFCQVSRISFSFDPRREQGNRLLRDTVQCRGADGKMMPVDEKKIYLCALKTWIFYGNDGFPCTHESKIVRCSDTPLPRLLSKYIAGMKTVGDGVVPQISSRVEDRIRCVCPDEQLLQAYRRV